jgi:hypothetical protein
MPSAVMVFQMRAIDKARIVRKIGRLSEADMTRVNTEVWRMLKPPVEVKPQKWTLAFTDKKTRAVFATRAFSVC